MAEVKKEKLSSEERKTAMMAIFELVGQYPGIKELPVIFEDFDKSKGASVAVFSEPGAYINRKFITGGFEGVVPFSVVYRATPKLSKQKINMIAWLEELADWLQNEAEYPLLIGGGMIEKIEASTIASKDMSDSAGDHDYVIVFDMTYRKE